MVINLIKRILSFAIIFTITFTAITPQVVFASQSYGRVTGTVVFDYQPTPTGAVTQIPLIGFDIMIRYLYGWPGVGSLRENRVYATTSSTGTFDLNLPLSADMPYTLTKISQ